MPRVHAVVELERAALARWCHGEPDGFLQISADDVTYFDPFAARRVDGLENLRAHYDAIRGQVFVSRYEFQDIRVQEAGDVAVLTYHFHSWGGTNRRYVGTARRCTGGICRAGASSRRIGRFKDQCEQR